jgi:hypothetical protein
MADSHHIMDDPECCRCGEPIEGFYFLTEDNASPVHWGCLSEEEQERKAGEVPV